MPLEAAGREKEIEALFTSSAGRLRAIVAHNVTASSGVIEEACQTAWIALATHDEPISRDAALGWLATTASREALRLLRADRLHISLQAPDVAAWVHALPARTPSPAHVAELHDRLAEVRRLPVRQQRMVWMHGAGYDYGEIAARTGDSRRTVERQLMRAKRTLRVLGTEPDDMI